MDGWNNETAPQGAPPNAPYSYVPQREIEPYWTMASHYVLSDQTFASNLDGSFVSHQYAVAALLERSGGLSVAIRGAAPAGKADTVADLTKNRTIRRVHPRLLRLPNPRRLRPTRQESAGDSTPDILTATAGSGRPIRPTQDLRRSRLERRRHQPAAQFLVDVANGQLANVTWVAPTFETSDHPGILAPRRSAVGRLDRRRDRREYVLEIDRHLHAVGRLGGLVRSRTAGL